MQTAVRRKQAERRQDAEEKLLDAAMELVAEAGYEGVTLALVGERAGFSRGLPIHYFGSREALMAAVARRTVDLFMKRIEDRSSAGTGLDPISSVLREIALSTYERRVSSSALAVIINAARVHKGLVDVVKSLNNKSMDWISEVFVRGIAASRIRKDIDIASESAAIVAFHRGCSALFAVDPSFPIRKVTENYILELERRLALPGD